MFKKPKKIVNAKTAVRCIIYPVAAIPERTEEMNRREVLKPVEIKKRLPGTALLIKMGKEREKAKMKRIEKRRVAVNEDEIKKALERIMADLE